MLIDLNACVHPRLYIMDGVAAMEGNGPRGGTPRQMNVLLFSTDPIALDATICRLMNLDPALVLTNRAGMEMGAGTYLPEEIRLLGDPIEPLIASDFQVNREPEQTKPKKERPAPQKRDHAEAVYPCRTVRPLRHLRQHVPGNAKGRELAQRQQAKSPVVSIRPVHPLLLLSGNVPGERHTDQGAAPS